MIDTLVPENGGMISSRIRARLPEYVSRRRADLQRIEEFVRTREFAQIVFIGHNLKGSAASYGLPELGAVGADLEAAAQRCDATAIQQHTGQLGELVERIQTSLDSGAF